MINISRKTSFTVLTAAGFAVTACGAEPGSESWCADLKAKPPLEWSMEERSTYDKTCLKRDIERQTQGLR